jgi:hypothetical protein
VKQVNQMAKIFELEKEISKQREVLTKYVSPSQLITLKPQWLALPTLTRCCTLCRMRKAEYSIVNPYANTRGEL